MIKSFIPRFAASAVVAGSLMAGVVGMAPVAGAMCSNPDGGGHFGLHLAAAAVQVTATHGRCAFTTSGCTRTHTGPWRSRIGNPRIRLSVN